MVQQLLKLLHLRCRDAEIDPETGEIIWFEPSTQAMFYKNDEAGNMLAGATMRITDKDGNRVEGVLNDWVSSAAERHLVYGLPDSRRGIHLAGGKCSSGL